MGMSIFIHSSGVDMTLTCSFLLLPVLSIAKYSQLEDFSSCRPSQLVKYSDEIGSMSAPWG